MKCQGLCKKKLTIVSYYRGKQVCPSCFNRMKWRDTHLSRKDYCELAKRRVERWKKRRLIEKVNL